MEGIVGHFNIHFDSNLDKNRLHINLPKKVLGIEAVPWIMSSTKGSGAQ